MKHKLQYLFLLFFIYSCQGKKTETAYLEKKIAAHKKIKWVFESKNSDILKMEDSTVLLLKKFYKKRKYKPLWVNNKTLTSQGENVLKLLCNPLSLGVPAKRISSQIKSKTLILKEISMTVSLASLHHDLKKGILDTVVKKQRPLSYSWLHKYPHTVFVKSHKLEDIAAEIISWGPKDTVYQNLAKAYFKFSYNKKFIDQNLKVPTWKKDSLQSLNLAKKALRQKGYLAWQKEDSTSFNYALKAFQLDNGLKDDAVVGQTTADALNETMLEKCQRTSLVLEKLRWRRRYEKRYIEVNIPEYTLRFFADDTLKSVNKIIVGKFDTQTPEFSAELSRIIAYPFWSVPFSITSKEILPDAKKSPSYFARNHMKIYKKDEEIDPYSVNWKGIRKNTFPYKVIQQPGSHNSLGIIKFDFNNKYGVYFHDTPQKGLFNTVVRSYSHGCMRCQNPVDLAKIILLKDENKVIPDSLDSILSRQVNHPVFLKKRIPIYVEYRSVVTNNERKIVFLRDIYRRDKRLAKMMFA